jgi:hypothetical protein
MSNPVPFEISPTVSELTSGIIAIGGILRYDATAVTLEHRTTDSRMAASAVGTTTIPLAAIVGIEYHRKLVSARLVLIGSGLDVFRNVPGADDNHLVLRIKRRDRGAARRAAWDLQVAVEERKLRHLREGST